MSVPGTVGVGFDLLLLDREDAPVAFVQVKTRPLELWSSTFHGSLRYSNIQAPFAILADLKEIRLYEYKEGALSEPILTLDSAEVLSHYDPRFATIRIFHEYMLILVEVSLDDLAFHWKSTNPPRADDVRKAGLLDRIQGGSKIRVGD